MQFAQESEDGCLVSDRDHSTSYGNHAFSVLFKKYSLGGTTYSGCWD